MQRINRPHPPQRKQRGITLLETLVALIVSVLGILGILGMQMRTLVDTQTSVRRAQAIRLIEDLSERMRVHPNALTSLEGYLGSLDETIVSGFTDKPSATGCTGSTPCGPDALFIRDLGVWKENVANALPGGQANVFIAPWAEDGVAVRSQIGIMVRWRENERTNDSGERDDDYMNAIDVVTANGGATVECNGENEAIRYTCHLQYISVASRCARSTDGKDYCPGSQ